MNGQEQSEARSADSLRVSSLFDQQMSLLEQAKRYCAQASDLGQRCATGIRKLNQRLKESG